MKIKEGLIKFLYLTGLLRGNRNFLSIETPELTGLTPILSSMTDTLMVIEKTPKTVVLKSPATGTYHKIEIENNLKVFKKENGSEYFVRRGKRTYRAIRTFLKKNGFSLEADSK